MHILLVEDQESMAIIFSRMLQKFDHEVTVVHNGPAALEMLESIEPDLVLCDLTLPPGMSGYDVAREIRQRPETRDLVLIALTAHQEEVIRRKALDAGFDHFETKPMDFTQLSKVVEEIRASRRDVSQCGTASNDR